MRGLHYISLLLISLPACATYSAAITDGSILAKAKSDLAEHCGEAAQNCDLTVKRVADGWDVYARLKDTDPALGFTVLRSGGDFSYHYDNAGVLAGKYIGQ